jgi:hypothetical protein
MSKAPIARTTPALRKRRRGERKVRFSPVCHNKHENSILTDEEIKNTWYTLSDERCFKQDAARALTDYKRKSLYHPNKGSDAVTESVPRGLERHTKQRRHHKKQLVRFIVLAHQRGYHPDDIALFSQSKSNWNTELATTQASIDEIEVLLDVHSNPPFCA